MEISRTRKPLAEELGVGPSGVSDYISGRAEPTLRIARAICLSSVSPPPQSSASEKN